MKCKNLKIAIVIPIYKNTLDEKEKIALKQALNVLSKYDIIAVSPEELVLDETIFSKIERFNNTYFYGVESYNRLMLSGDFYSRFLQYDYILVYQLDAFVFCDRLKYFCDLGYDYIGAPWLHGMFNYKDPKHAVWYVGNGGLSLRKVDSFLQIVEKIKPLEGDQIKNEDLFFSSVMDEDFHVAPMEIALQFAFERQVKRCYEINNCKLPFGCHAWERYDMEFWKSHIEACGHDLSKICFNNSHEDVLREKEYIHWNNISKIFSDILIQENVENKLKKLLSEKEVIIWGAGFYGTSIAKWLQNIGIIIISFCDNDIRLKGKVLNHIPVVYSGNMRLNQNSYIVIANYTYEYEIEKQLLDSGIVGKENYMLFSQLAKL